MRVLIRTVSVLVCTALTALPAVAQNEDRSSLRPEAMSLPSGPGTISGLGESFELNASQGTASYSIPIEVPRGAGGHRPTLRLAYSGAREAGELGIGWSFGLPVVRRSLRDGIAWNDREERVYGDQDRLSLMGLEGAGDLVSMPDGSWRLDPEGAFLRASSLGGSLEGGVVVEDAAGTRYFFGADCGGELAPDPSARVVGPVGTFEWHLTCVLDVHGNTIRYDYANTTNRPELQAIRWNLAASPHDASISFEWEARPDVVRRFVSGTESALTRRVRRVVVRRGAYVHRTVELTYHDEIGLSRLGSVRLVGWDGTAAPTLSLRYADMSAMMRPDEVRAIEGGPSFGLRRESAELVDFDGDGVPDLLEMDQVRVGEYRWFRGTPTLADDGRVGLAFASPTPIPDAPTVFLGESASGTARRTQLVDVTGDARADILFDRGTPGSTDLRFIELRAVDAASRPLGATSPLTPFEPTVRISDVDLDRRPDLIELLETGDVRIAFGSESWNELHTLRGASPDPSLRLDNPIVRLADMNGDGLDDLVVLREGTADGLRYYPGSGLGRFSGQARVTGFPSVLTSADIAAAQLRDMTGDGLPDLVLVGSSRVTIWPLEGTDRLAAEPVMVSALPPRRGDTTAVRLVDVNANGTTDILWVDGTNPGPGACAGGWCYVDLLESGSPALLQEVDNGIGLVTELRYVGMAEMQAQARALGLTDRGALTPPEVRNDPVEDDASVPMMVLSSRRVRDQVHLDTRERFLYAGGHYDRVRREFLGFRRILTERLGTEDVHSWRTLEEYDVGASSRAHAGQLRAREQREVDPATSDTVARRREEHDLRLIPIGISVRDGAIERSVIGEMRSWRYEPGTDDPVAMTRVVNEHDALGFQTVSRNFGLVDPDAPTTGAGGFENDEVVTRTEYVHCLGERRPECSSSLVWRVGVVVGTSTEDEAGVQTAAERRYYDDQPRGVVAMNARLLVSTRETWVESTGASERWVAETTDHDRHGNVVHTGGAEGQSTAMEYEPTGTYLATVRRATGNAAFPELVWTAVFDATQGDVLTEVTGPDGAVEALEYDGLGRPLRHWMPGDDREGPPAETFAYQQRSPISRIDTTRVLDEVATRHVSTYVTGGGVTLATVSQVDPERWVVSGLIERNALGWTTRAYEPSYSNAAPGDELPTVSADVPYTTKSYDAQGREVRVTDARAATTETVYGARSRTVYDALDVERGRATATPVTTRQDGQGRLIETIEPRLEGRPALRFPVTYDASGNAVRIPDAHGAFLTVTYDGRGLHTRVEHPSFSFVTRSYDDSGRLVREEDADGRVRTWSYDLVDRETRLEAIRDDGTPDEPIVRHYDVDPGGRDAGFSAGRLVTASAVGGTRSYTYDARGRVTEESFRYPDGYTATRTTGFDAGDRMITRSWPNGVTLDYAYDLGDRLASIPGTGVDNLEHDARGNMLHADLPRDVTLDLGYDAAGLLTGIRSAREGTAFVDLLRTLDGNSNPTLVTDSSGQSPFGPEVRYTYDELDRLTSMTSDGLRATFVLADSQRLRGIETDLPGHAVHLGLDDDGDRGLPTSVEMNGGSDEVHWSAAGVLLAMGRDRYDWNGRGDLVALSDSGSSYHLIRDADGLIVDRDSVDGLVREPFDDYHEKAGTGSSVLAVGAGARVNFGVAIGDSATESSASFLLVPLALGLLLLSAQQRNITSLIVFATLALGCHDTATTPGLPEVEVLDWQGSPLALVSHDSVHRVDVAPFASAGTGSPGASARGFVGGTTVTSRVSVLGRRAFVSGLSSFASIDPRFYEMPNASTEDPRSYESVGYGRLSPVRWSDPLGYCSGDHCPPASREDRLNQGFGGALELAGSFAAFAGLGAACGATAGAGCLIAAIGAATSFIYGVANVADAAAGGRHAAGIDAAARVSSPVRVGARLIGDAVELATGSAQTGRGAEDWANLASGGLGLLGGAGALRKATTFGGRASAVAEALDSANGVRTNPAAAQALEWLIPSSPRSSRDVHTGEMTPGSTPPQSSSSNVGADQGFGALPLL